MVGYGGSPENSSAHAAGSGDDDGSDLQKRAHGGGGSGDAAAHADAGGAAAAGAALPPSVGAAAPAATPRPIMRRATTVKRATASAGMRHTILSVPPFLEAAGLGFQQYLTMLGSTVLIPFICVPAMGGTPEGVRRWPFSVYLANTICTIFFVSGIITLVQTWVGDRLPIIQGGSFAYINPVLAIATYVQATGTFADGHERFLVTMREVQGGIIGSGAIVALIGLSGVIRPLLRAISPITVAANIGVLGLALYQVGFPGVAACPQLGVMQIVLVVLFSQYLRGVAVPLWPNKPRVRLFELFPVLLSILIAWFVAWVCTIAGAYDAAPADVQKACRTDQSRVLADSPWFRVPYPGQWGPITFSWSSTLTMLAGALPAMVESLGDYFAAATISGAPVPPPAVISRAITVQGLTCMLAGAWGTSSGTTAYNENIGAMQLTRVGSRRVVQYGACVAIALALLGKFGGLFASLPEAQVSGLFCVMFGLITAVGIAQMQYAEQNNRNIFVLGFGLYMGLSISYYFTSATEKKGQGPIASGSAVADAVLNSVFGTAAAVTLLLTLFLDNTIPGSDEERGLAAWRCLVTDADTGEAMDWWEDEELGRVYGLPFGLTRRWQRAVAQPLGAWWRRRVAAPARAALAGPCGALRRAWRAATTCGGRVDLRAHSAPESALGLPPGGIVIEAAELSPRG